MKNLNLFICLSIVLCFTNCEKNTDIEKSSTNTIDTKKVDAFVNTLSISEFNSPKYQYSQKIYKSLTALELDKAFDKAFEKSITQAVERKDDKMLSYLKENGADIKSLYRKVNRESVRRYGLAFNNLEDSKLDGLFQEINASQEITQSNQRTMGCVYSIFAEQIYIGTTSASCSYAYDGTHKNKQNTGQPCDWVFVFPGGRYTKVGSAWAWADFILRTYGSNLRARYYGGGTGYSGGTELILGKERWAHNRDQVKGAILMGR